MLANDTQSGLSIGRAQRAGAHQLLHVLSDLVTDRAKIPLYDKAFPVDEVLGWISEEWSKGLLGSLFAEQIGIGDALLLDELDDLVSLPDSSTIPTMVNSSGS